MATSQTEKPWVNIAIRLIPLLVALGLVLGFAALWTWPPQTDSLPDFVQKHASYAECIVAKVKEVGGKEKSLASTANIDGRASLQQQLSDAKDSFDNACKKMVPSGSHPPARHESDYDDMEAAVGQVSSAVSTAKSFVDSQKPSELANFTTEWICGRRHWNKAVTNIWNAASKAPPLVDDTTAAVCPQDVS
jgi:hypothetical protein